MSLTVRNHHEHGGGASTLRHLCVIRACSHTHTHADPLHLLAPGWWRTRAEGCWSEARSLWLARCSGDVCTGTGSPGGDRKL